MVVPQLYLNGCCYEAMELYQKAFHTKVDSIMHSTCLVQFIDRFGTGESGQLR